MKTNKRLLFSIFLTLCFTWPLAAQDFVHPGVLNTEADYARMRQKIAEKAEPWLTAWNNLLAAPEAQLTWAPRATATVIRGGTGDNIVLMYRDVAAAYEHALIYKISGDTRYGNKAAEILNAWANVNTLVSGNADRYLAAGLNGYQFAAAAEMMRAYPAFNMAKFKTYLMNVFYLPMNERFLLGNSYGSAHNDACATNYRVNWDICNMNAMMAISVFCDYKEGFNKVLNYAKTGSGTGNITRAVNFLYPNLPTTSANIWGQWEESGRDQGHAVGGLMLYALFCEMAWNQGVDFYGYDNARYRKGAEYVARYNIFHTDTANVWSPKYNDLPYTTYSRQMGSTCTWYTESALGSATRGKYGNVWELIYNHYARRMNQGDKVKSVYEILKQQPSTRVPSTAIHADTYDQPAVIGLTHCSDSASCIFPWNQMDICPRSLTKLKYYGAANLTDSLLTISGSGTGISAKADYGHFVFQKLVDNGSISAQLLRMDSTSTTSQAGLLVRDSLDQVSKNVFLSYSPANGITLSVRDTLNKNQRVVATVSEVITLPCWLKISRTANQFTALYSTDNQNWIVVGSAEVKMNRLASAGPAVSSGNTTLLTTAVFDKAILTQGNIRPVAKISTPAYGRIPYVAPANVVINATAYDPDGLIDKAEIYINDSLYFTSKISPVSYNLATPVTGSYKLYVKAYDKTGATQTSDTVFFSVNTASTKLPYYKFDETKAGYSAADASGNGLLGVLYNGSAVTTGKIDNAVWLDGIDDYVKMPSGFIEKLSDFSISTWVYVNAQSNWSRIFDFGSGTSAFMFLTAYNGSVMKFAIQTSDGRTQEVLANTAMPVGVWTHVAVTLGADKATIYLNGNQVGTTSAFKLRPYDLGTTTQNYIGKSQFAADTYLSAKIDEFRVFNKSLTQSEVKEIMSVTALNKTTVDSELFYPNPAGKIINLRHDTQVSVQIFDMTGTEVYHRTISGSNQQINVADLNNGLYLLICRDAYNNVQQNKLIVQH